MFSLRRTGRCPRILCIAALPVSQQCLRGCVRACPVETGSGTMSKSALEGLGRHVLAALPESVTEVLPLLSVGFVHLILCRLCDGVPAARSIPPSVSLRLPAGFRPRQPHPRGVRSAHMPQSLGAGSRVWGGHAPPHPNTDSGTEPPGSRRHSTLTFWVVRAVRDPDQLLDRYTVHRVKGLTVCM